jgi:ankyrin repeat protein
MSVAHSRCPFFLFTVISLCLAGCNDTSKNSVENETINKEVSSTQRIPTKGKLSLAVLKGDTAQVLELLKMGADINENIGTEEQVITPLLLAIAEANSAMTQLMLQNGAEQNLTYGGYKPKDLAHFQSLNNDALNSFGDHL